jgi:fructokinase
LGSEGCAVFSEDKLITVPGFPVTVVDTVGAGDAFTAGFLHGLIHKWPLTRTAQFANALGSIVAGRATAIPDWTPAEVLHLLNDID